MSHLTYEPIIEKDSIQSVQNTVVFRYNTFPVRGVYIESSSLSSLKTVSSLLKKSKFLLLSLPCHISNLL